MIIVFNEQQKYIKNAFFASKSIQNTLMGLNYDSLTLGLILVSLNIFEQEYLSAAFSLRFFAILRRFS
jgi:hypothetical protein